MFEAIKHGQSFDQVQALVSGSERKEAKFHPLVSGESVQNRIMKIPGLSKEESVEKKPKKKVEVSEAGSSKSKCQ